MHRLQAAGGERLSDHPPFTDVRVGSATDGRVPVSVATRSLAPGLAQWLSLAVVALACIAADQVTKGIVRSELVLHESVDLAGPFAIHHVRNTGIAFGLFPGAANPVTILTGIAVIWMLVYFARSGARHPFLPVALGLLLGGSLSNLVDRARQGYVTDFIDPEYWPAFNLGDVFITIGVLFLLATFLVFERRSAGLNRRPRTTP
jgi:signal peptidase II